MRPVNLKCEKCNSFLHGENNSTIFFCTECNSAYIVERGSLRRFDLKYIKPGLKRDMEMVYFAFWSVKAKAIVKRDTGEEIFSGLKLFHIPAFFIKNINYFGDIGLFYMNKQVELKEDDKQKISLFPADREPGAALKYQEVYLLSLFGKSAGSNPDISIRTEPVNISVSLIPFYRKARVFYDSYLLWEYPSGALI